VADYWLEELVYDYDIRTLDDAIRLLDSDSKLIEISERYTGFSKPLDPLPESAGARVIAGTVLDLSGDLDCGTARCIKGRVDNLYGHVWHYFDDVVVTGASSKDLDKMAKAAPDFARRSILNSLDVFLYLQETGARDLMLFRERPRWCIHDLPAAAEGLGIDHLDEMRTEYVATALPQASFYKEPEWTGKFYLCQLLRLDGVARVRVWEPEGTSQEVLLRAALEVEFHEIADHFASDVLRSRAYSAPLAVHNDLHGNWLQGNAVVSESQVALSLDLPVLRHISPKEIALVRKEEGAAFEAFRIALRRAIRERVAAASSGDTNESIAREIAQDVLAPAVLDIERGLQAAQRTMARKSSSRVAVGMVGAAAGLLTGFPEIVTGALGLSGFTASLVPVKDEYDKAKAEIEIKDMYFLWKAGKRAPQV
jgi:hypothetical protein